MKITRRHFLRSTVGSAALVSLGQGAPGFLHRASAQAARDGAERVLVVLQLSGGNDGINTVVPFAHDAYQANRFTLRLTPDRILKINDQIGLHPGLTGFAKLLDQDQLAIVQGVGYPDPDRSHFNSMDIWHTARRDLAARRTGWVGRYLDAQPGEGWRAVHVGQERQPLALTGARAYAPTVESLSSLQLNNQPKFQSQLPDLITSPRKTPTPLLEFLQAHALQAVVASEQIQRAVQEESGPVRYPEYGLGQRLRLVAQLIEADLGARVFYVTLAGFDTHADQAGAHAALLRELGDSLSAFMEDLNRRSQQDRVLVMMFSEFGRRLQENASRGTDHGAAAPMFLAGGRVPTGLIGEHPRLDDLDQGDLKFHTDFRAVYAGALEQWLGVESAPILGGAFVPVRLTKPVS